MFPSYHPCQTRLRRAAGSPAPCSLVFTPANPYPCSYPWPYPHAYPYGQVNYRGSSGYSKSFLHKGDKGWGIGPMQHDLSDAVAWAVEQGVADKDKVCIYGGSYGGYATLAGLTFTPELYAEAG